MSVIETYQEHAVTTRTPGRLVVLLYEGAIRYLRQARAHAEAQNWYGMTDRIVYANRIIRELNAALDMEKGGKYAQDMRGLYLFMVQRLLKAMTEKDVQTVDEVIELLETLLPGWKEIAE